MLLYVLLIAAPGGFEWVLIFLAVVLLFGARKVPELMKNVGKGIREFNDAKDSGKKKEDSPAVPEKEKEPSK